MKPIEIDALAMIRQIRDAEYSKTKTMDNEDFISYVRKKAKVAHEEAMKLIQASSTAIDRAL
ncbi:hypothetical protein [Candidatus Electronema sp. PJ]|uniref:hypothetical protein n=1 Tax=Candidatus Electronema sp. PJ TaxID=3401572 RepID=UPI003AA88CAF